MSQKIFCGLRKKERSTVVLQTVNENLRQDKPFSLSNGQVLNVHFRGSFVENKLVVIPHVNFPNIDWWFHGVICKVEMKISGTVKGVEISTKPFAASRHPKLFQEELLLCKERNETFADYTSPDGKIHVEITIEFSEVDTKVPNGFKQVQNPEKYSDVVIKVGEKEFNLHKIILANSSERFDEIFSQDPTRAVIDLPDVSLETFEDFVDYLYFGKITTDTTKLLRLLKFSTAFNSSNLQQFCDGVLRDNVDNNNCEEIFYAAHENNCSLGLKSASFGLLRSKYASKILIPKHLIADPETVRALIA